MNDIAFVSFQGGGLILPARTSYERELVVEHVEASAKRHGAVRFEFNGHHWTISMNDPRRAVCASCSQWPAELTYPGGATGALAVLSGRAVPCTKVTCEQARADAHA